MNLANSLSISNPPLSSSLLRPSHGDRRISKIHWGFFPTRRTNLSGGDRGFLSGAGAGRTRAKPKEMILGNPSVTVEKGKYSYDVETLINKLSSLPPRGSIARCLDIFKNKLSLNDFALVFKEFAQRGDWQRSLRLFKYMQRQIWCKPNEHIYTIMIGVLGREGLLDKCAEIFDEMPTHGVPRSVFSFTALINAYGRNGDYQTSLELLDRMKRERVSPSILTYNTVINSCARGGLDWEGLLGLFAEMRHEGIQPDLVTYNTLLSACGSRGLGDEAEMVFRSMNEAGIMPDLSTHTYLVETFGKLGKLEKVSELLKEMESAGNLPDFTSYNVLLEAYARSGSIKEAMGVFRQMQAAGCLPNAVTYSILLNLYGRQGRYEDVRELFLEMKVSNTEADAATYNILIQVFGEGGYFKEVVTLFDDMVEENIEPNMETYEGLIFACGKGGLHEDAKRILLHMYEKGVVPSSKVYTGAVEAYGQAALYEEALVAFNTMNEVGSKPTVETYNSLIRTFARGGLYKESEAIIWRLADSGIARSTDSFNALIEAYGQGGQFEEAVKAYVEMEKARCNPDRQTLEAVLSVYHSAGLVDESKDQFQEIKASGIMPSVMCYCMLLSVYAKSDSTRLEQCLEMHGLKFSKVVVRDEVAAIPFIAVWDDAYELLEEMITNRVSNAHQVIGQMIKGDYDDDSNWQMVEYVFDKFNSEGCGLGLRLYNALLEALWWLGQNERAARVLNEATKRGLYPELFRKSKLVWSVDVHRMSVGGALTAISVWLNNIYEMFKNREDLPHLAAVVVARGVVEKSSVTRETPIAKAVYLYLKDNVSPSFCFPGWNKGRIICHRPQLKRILLGYESSSDGSTKAKFVSINNSTFPCPGTRTSMGDVKSSQRINVDSGTGIRTRTNLMTTRV